MELQLLNIIEKVINIPISFNIRNNISQINLVHESGYNEEYDRVTEQAIAETLKMHPHLINEWLQWSEDKRSFPTWHFSKADSGKYYVDYSDENAGFATIISTDRFQACAAFIKREVEFDRILYQELKNRNS